MRCTVSFLRDDCGVVVAQLFHPEREEWARTPWMPYCRRCLNDYLDGCDEGLYREPKAIQFRVGELMT